MSVKPIGQLRRLVQLIRTRPAAKIIRAAAAGIAAACLLDGLVAYAEPGPFGLATAVVVLCTPLPRDTAADRE